jgi:hypothetical protein
MRFQAEDKIKVLEAKVKRLTEKLSDQSYQAEERSVIDEGFSALAQGMESEKQSFERRETLQDNHLIFSCGNVLSFSDSLVRYHCAFGIVTIVFFLLSRVYISPAKN